jgi:hypothetical protein
MERECVNSIQMSQSSPVVRILNRIVALMMEAVSSPETRINNYQSTRCNIPEDSHLQRDGPSDSIKRREFLDQPGSKAGPETEVFRGFSQFL